jgi:hypothetical protein
MGEVDLRLEAIGLGASGTGGPGALSIAGGLKMSADLLCFMLFERAGMGLFLGDTHLRQNIENSFAFNFQLSS